jgi:hypothetical protein
MVVRDEEVAVVRVGRCAGPSRANPVDRIDEQGDRGTSDARHQRNSRSLSVMKDDRGGPMTMSTKQRRFATFIPIFVAIITAGGGLLAAYANAPNRPNVNAVIPSTTGNAYPRPTCPGPSKPLASADTVAFANLHDGDPVDYAVTTPVGHAALSPDHTLWLLTWASVAARMFVLSGPVVVVNGSWSVNGLYLGEGNTNDEGKMFCITAVIVDEAGATVFANAVKNGIGIPEDALPDTGTATTIVVTLRHGTPPQAHPAAT